MKKFECHINIDSATSIIEALQAQCDLSVAELKKAIDKGALWHSRGNTIQRCRRLKKPLKTMDKLHFYYDADVLSQIPTPATLIADLEDYSVWYKPYGMLSQGSKWSEHCTITRWAQKNLAPERATFTVHRLDRAATGLILVAHTKTAARALSRMFEQHLITKIYHIIVHGQQLTQPETVNLAINNKPARSHFFPLEQSKKNNLSLLQVKIESGRKHQIRIHAASIGLPIVGDRLHGNIAEYPQFIIDNKPADLQLCAVQLKFTCPISQLEQVFTLPDNLQPQLSKFANA